ncbi:hypothetical protein JR316_0013284 [Psilocybe cubensis]|uniref:F-box domain-containing protein n=2 Tax=Psilocybe cubensis TaxID=181762 RepID=A0A8H7XUE7_PSICU|nr:hypothetical protein JR316_0013284 [Psilocybe cubensis]KAH9474818.1 hypothetical protein JR316_0013284 [Psilocybe cubensis]
MPVQTISLTDPNTSFGSHGAGVLSIRPFNTSRIKIAATAFLRHGYLTPSHQHINELRRHNQSVLACTLPEQVLQNIFITCAQLTAQDFENSDWSWVNISYVCSTWRRILLDCPDFWRYVDFSDPRWHAVTLSRAKMSSIHVITTVTENNIRLLHRSLQLAHRIQDIHLKSSIENIYPLLDILAHPNPALESLIIDIHIPQNNGPISGFGPPSFPTTGPPLTNLKYLELHHAPFYLLTSRCTSLTHFHLHDLPHSERPTLRYFLFMLEQLKQLRYLTLDRAFPINMDMDDIKALERPIRLPRLESISLVGSVPDIANILACITIPASTHLVCKIYTLSDIKGNIWKLTEALSSHSWGEQDVDSPLETLVISGSQSDCPRYKDSAVPFPNPDFRQSLRIRAFRAELSRGGAAIDITISPDQGDASNDHGIITALSAIWRALPLTHIHTLALQDVDIITQKTWSPFLRTLPSLRVLDITGRAPSGLVWALLLNARSHGQGLKGDGDAQRLLVPRLADLYLQNVDCSSGGYMVAARAPVNSHFDLDDSRFLDVLVACLNKRRKFGLCLRSLSIGRCSHVLRSTVIAARKTVAYLTFDCLNVEKDEDVDPSYPARYSSGCDFRNSKTRHYYRLRTLIQLDAEG